MTTQEKLQQKFSATMQDGRDYLMDNYEENLSEIYNLCLNNTVSNYMLEDLLKDDFPWITAQFIADYFTERGFNGEALFFNTNQSGGSNNSNANPDEPTITITNDQDGDAASENILYTFSFSEALNGFTADDITLSHGTKGTFTSVDHTTYTLVVTPPADYEGEITVSVNDNAAKDSDDNWNSSVTPHTQLVDTKGPALTISGIEISDDNGVSDSDFITDTTLQTITATLSAPLSTGETLWGSVDGGASWTEVTDKVTDTAISCDNISLVKGTNEIQIKVLDSVGNSSAIATQEYTLDTDSPSLTISDIDISNDSGSNTDFFTNASSQTITATLSRALEDGEKLYGSVDGGANWTEVTDHILADGVSVRCNNISLLEGSNTIQIKVADTAGNTSAIASQSYRLDITAPTQTISNIDISADSNIDTDFITNTTTQTITATLSAALNTGESLWGSVDGGANWTDVTSKVNGTAISCDNITLLNGTNELQIKVQDSVGNSGAVATQQYTLDTASSSVTDADLSRNSIIDSKAGTSVTATITFDEDMDQTSTPLLTSNAGTTLTNPTNGRWSDATHYLIDYTVADANVDLNDITFDISGATDVAGNLQNIANAVGTGTTVDTLNPTASATTANIQNTGDAVVQSTETGTAYLVNTNVAVNSLSDITGAADDQWNSVAIATANQNTNLAATGLVDGTYKVYSVDSAGNLSSASNNSVTISSADTQAPSVTGFVSIHSGQTFNDSNVAAAPMTLSITYDEEMDQNVDPNVVFLNNPSGSLIDAGGSWQDAYTYSKDIVLLTDQNEVINDVSIQIINAQDLAGNVQNVDVQATGVKIDTGNPSVTGFINGNSGQTFTDADVGVTTLSLEITFDQDMNIFLNPNILTNENSLVPGPGLWTSPTTFWNEYSINDNNEEVADVQITVSFAQDAAGNVQTNHNSTSINLAIDTLNPMTTLTSATIQNTDNATVESSEIGTVYLVKDSIIVNSLSDITSASADEWNQVTIVSANTPTNLSATGLVDGDYVAYAVDGAGNLSNVSGDSVTINGPTYATNVYFDDAGDTSIAAATGVGGLSSTSFFNDGSKVVNLTTDQISNVSLAGFGSDDILLIDDAMFGNNLNNSWQGGTVYTLTNGTTYASYARVSGIFQFSSSTIFNMPTNLNLSQFGTY